MNALRQATPDDLTALRTLDAICFEEGWSEQSWQRFLADPQRYCCWLLETHGHEVIGYLLFSRILDESELLRIGVSPDRRGTGLARLMLSQAQRWLETAGIRQFHLEVRESNCHARQLYQRCGWQLSGRRRDYYSDASGSEDALLFSRHLD